MTISLPRSDRRPAAADVGDKSLNVLLLDTKPDNPNAYIVLAILAALRADGRVARADRVTYATAIPTAQARRYDALLAVDGEQADTDILQRLCALVDVSVLWAWEDPYEVAETARMAPLFDLVFTNDKGSEGAGFGGARFLPLAAGAFLPVRENDADYAYDLSFVGTAWPNRVLFLRRLLPRLPRLRVNIRLAYNPHIPKLGLDMPESDYVGAVGHADFLDIANRSRVNLVLHRAYSGDGRGAQAQSPGPRLFETAGAGGFQLTDTRDMSVDPYLRPGVHLETFDGEDACAAAIEAALAEPARRIAAARAAQEEVRAKHTYANRVRDLLDAVAAKRDRPRACATPQVPRKPRLLFVTHNTVGQGHFGGVEVYQDVLARELRGEFDIYFYRRASLDGAHAYELTDVNHRVMERLVTETPSNPAELERLFADILVRHEVNIVHFHHLINHTPSLTLVSKALGVKSILTLQDFYSVCESFNLIDYRGRYCAGAPHTSTACDLCLERTSGLAPGAQALRRELFAKVLDAVDTLVANSQSTLDIYRSVYPSMAERPIPILGLPEPRSRAPKRSNTRADGPLRVAFLGNFSPNKGADCFLEVVRALASDKNICFTILGRVEERYEQALKDAAFGTVEVVGTFAPGDIDLSRFDVSLHLSTWPETYCITLSEAWRAGLAPIATDIGALAERITHGVNGLKAPVDGAGEIVGFLQALEADRAWLQALRNGADANLWLTPSAHAEKLREIYAGPIGGRDRTIASRRIDNRHLATASILKGPSFVSAWRSPPPSVLSDDVSPGWTYVDASVVRHVEAALADGNAYELTALEARVDAVHDADLRTFRLRGVLIRRSVPAGRLLFMLRRTDGAVLLRAFAPDSIASVSIDGPQPSSTLAFEVETFDAWVLESGVYACEIVELAEDGRVGLFSLDVLCCARAGRLRFLQSPNATVPRRSHVPFDTQSEALGCVDRLEIVELFVGERAATLLIEGWLLAPKRPSDFSVFSVAIVERATGVVRSAPLRRRERPDVVEAIEGATIACGFTGRVVLEGLGSGAYDVFVVAEDGEMSAWEKAGSFVIAPDATLSLTPSARRRFGGRNLRTRLDRLGGRLAAGGRVTEPSSSTQGVC